MSEEKYKNKYRVSSARASWWNYGWSGAYFITICTHTRLHYFGEIQNGKMALSNCGVLADVFWHEIPNHSKNIELGAFVVMPNHIHGILILDNPVHAGTPAAARGDGDVRTLPAVVETLHATSLQSQRESDTNKNHMSKISPNANTVSTIIRSYKSAVTKHANRLGIAFNWQPRFYDHIIRNDAEFQRINDYIENNASNWMQDKFFINETMTL